MRETTRETPTTPLAYALFFIKKTNEKHGKQTGNTQHNTGNTQPHHFIKFARPITNITAEPKSQTISILSEKSKLSNLQTRNYTQPTFRQTNNVSKASKPDLSTSQVPQKPNNQPIKQEGDIINV